MVNIDYIMELFNWNRCPEEQQKGLELAREVKCLTAFFQPGIPYGKPVWDNCALVLCEKSDEELTQYLGHLLKWLQDLNWPGALQIFERLQQYNKKNTFIFQMLYEDAMKYAEATGDENWRENLLALYSDDSDQK